MKRLTYKAICNNCDAEFTVTTQRKRNSDVLVDRNNADNYGMVTVLCPTCEFVNYVPQEDIK